MKPETLNPKLLKLRALSLNPPSARHRVTPPASCRARARWRRLFGFLWRLATKDSCTYVGYTWALKLLYRNPFSRPQHTPHIYIYMYIYIYLFIYLRVYMHMDPWGWRVMGSCRVVSHLNEGYEYSFRTYNPTYSYL